MYTIYSITFYSRKMAKSPQRVVATFTSKHKAIAMLQAWQREMNEKGADVYVDSQGKIHVQSTGRVYTRWIEVE